MDQHVGSGPPKVGLLVAAILVILSGLGACGGSRQDPLDPLDAGGQDPLVGTWTFSGQVPAFVNIVLSVNSDKTFTFVEQVAPATTPAGTMPDGCVTTDTFSATYAEKISGGTNTLTWTFTGGTANAVSGCSDTAPYDSAGTPMTSDAISSYIDQGMIPPTTVIYTVTSTTLILTNSANSGLGVGVGRNPGTTFEKSN